MKILITGFDSFADEKVNPSYLAVQQLPELIAGAHLVKTQVPTVFNESAQLLHQQIVEHKPDVVLNIGQAGGRSAISFERIAINLDDARIPDNLGQQPLDLMIQPNGATAYMTQLPIKAMAQAVREQGIPAQLSYSAGTFVCNHLMYQAQYLIATQFPSLKAGFIHVPFLPEQVVCRPNQPSMDLSLIVSGLTAAITSLIKFIDTDDIASIEGSLH